MSVSSTTAEEQRVVSRDDAERLGYTLSAADCARRLTLDSDISAVRQLLATGQIPSVRVRRSGSPTFRVRPADLEAFIAANTAPGPLPRDAITPHEAAARFGDAAALHNNAVQRGRVTVYRLLDRYRRYSRAEIEREYLRWKANVEVLESRREEIIRRYQNGQSINEVAEAVRRSPATVHHHLKRAEVQRRPLSESISKARLSKYEPLRAELVKAAPPCGSPQCTDPTCGVTPGHCHRAGCEALVAEAASTDASRRRVAGYPVLYCFSSGCPGLARAMRRRGGAAVSDVLAETGGCGSHTCTDPECKGPYGHCHTPACRRPAVLAPKTDLERRWLKGTPTMYCSECICAGAVLVRLNAEATEALLLEGLVTPRKAAKLVYWAEDTIRKSAKLPIVRREFGGLVRLGIDARAVYDASTDKDARRKLAKPLAALNETERFGAPLKLSDDEVARVRALRDANPAWGWRRLADELNTQRPLAKHVSHMTVKRAYERATAA